MEAWADGVYTEESAMGTTQLNARALGVVATYSGILELFVEDVK